MGNKIDFNDGLFKQEITPETLEARITVGCDLTRFLATELLYVGTEANKTTSLEHFTLLKAYADKLLANVSLISTELDKALYYLENGVEEEEGEPDPEVPEG